MAFDESNLEKKLLSVTNSQDSIQTLSLWILHHKSHAKRIIQTWLRILEKDKNIHRLTLFYLANDVVQHARKKNCKIYIDGFQEVLPRAATHVRDEKVREKVERVFNIWQDRNVYTEEFVNSLKEILHGQAKFGQEATSKIVAEFKLSELITQMDQIKSQVTTTEKQLSLVNLARIDSLNSEVLNHLKDRTHGEQYSREFDESQKVLQEAVRSLEKELHGRKLFLGVLEKSEIFYETQKNEAKIVANAYRNFGARVKTVKEKLRTANGGGGGGGVGSGAGIGGGQEVQYPSPPLLIDAPSPTGSDDGLVLPDSDTPLPGMRSLLSVFAEQNNNNNTININKLDKPSSLDQRLSSLMQNMPPSVAAVTGALSASLKQEKLSNNGISGPPRPLPPHPLVGQSSALNHPPPPPLPPSMDNGSNNNAQQQRSLQPVFTNPSNNFYHHGTMQVPPPPPPPPPPPSLEQMGGDHHLQHHHHQHSGNKFENRYAAYDAYSARMNSHKVNDRNSPLSHQIQHIQSVISSRDHKDAHLPGLSALHADPLSSVARPVAAPAIVSSGHHQSSSPSFDDYAPTHENFEPADMDLGNSDEEDALNRSQNSQRVLKVIETSDKTGNNNSSNNNHNSAYHNYAQPAVNASNLTNVGSNHHHHHHHQQQNHHGYDRPMYSNHQQYDNHQSGHHQHHHHHQHMTSHGYGQPSTASGGGGGNGSGSVGGNSNHPPSSAHSPGSYRSKHGGSFPSPNKPPIEESGNGSGGHHHHHYGHGTRWRPPPLPSSPSSSASSSSNHHPTSIPSIPPPPFGNNSYGNHRMPRFAPRGTPTHRGYYQ